VNCVHFSGGSGDLRWLSLVECKGVLVFTIVLSLAQLTCSASDAQPGIEHARLQGPSFEEVSSQIKLGMREQEVVSLLGAAHFPSGQAVRVEREKERERGGKRVFRVDVSRWHQMTYFFADGKLVDFATYQVGACS
jgi:hypothetical protein